MNILFFDFETQSADPFKTNPTELGCALIEWIPDENDFAKDEWKEIGNYNSLIYEKDYPPQESKIIKLTGITDEMLLSDGLPQKEVLNRFLYFYERADIIVAHKAYFDVNVLLTMARRCGVELPPKEVLCTLSNFPWPEEITCKKLSHIAYEHSILVDPKTLHRATDDVRLLARVLAKYDLQEVLKYAREPWVYLRAEVIEPWKDGGVMKESAQSFGFSWQKVRYVEELDFPKMWVTRVKTRNLTDLKDRIATAPVPFRTTIIEGLQ